MIRDKLAILQKNINTPKPALQPAKIQSVASTSTLPKRHEPSDSFESFSVPTFHKITSSLVIKSTFIV